MMLTPDVNVLLAAFRADHVHHRVARDFLTEVLQSGAEQTAFYLLPTVIASFLRLASNPNVFENPAPVADAIAFVDALNARVLNPKRVAGSEWPQFKKLCLDQKLSANSIPDAWIAAQILQQQDVLLTFDKDFKRLLPAKNLRLLKP